MNIEESKIKNNDWRNSRETKTVLKKAPPCAKKIDLLTVYVLPGIFEGSKLHSLRNRVISWHSSDVKGQSFYRKFLSRVQKLTITILTIR